MSAVTREWGAYDPREVILEARTESDRVQRSVSLAEMLADPFCLEPPVPLGLPGFASGRVTLLAGREKLGKSTLAAWVAARVTRGEGTPDGEPGTVLVVRLEGHPDEWVQALRRFRADINKTFLLNGLDHLDILADEVKATQPSLVIIDTLPSLVAALDGAVKDPSADSTGWMRLINSIAAIAQRPPGPAIGLLHHATKNNSGYRDSTAIGASVDMIMTMAMEKGDPAERAFETKGRWQVDPFRLRLNGDRFVFFGEGQSATPRDLKAVVLEFLRANPGVSLNKIVKGIRKNALEVSSAVRALEAEGLIYNDGTPKRHKWRVRELVLAPPSGTALEQYSEPIAARLSVPPQNGSGTDPEPLQKHCGTCSPKLGSGGVVFPLRGEPPELVTETEETPFGDDEVEEREDIQAEAET